MMKTNGAYEATFMSTPTRAIRAAAFFSLACIGASGFVWAQETTNGGAPPQQSTAPSGGWRRFGASDQSASPADPSYQASSQQPGGPQAGFPQYNGPQSNGPQSTA